MCDYSSKTAVGANSTQRAGAPEVTPKMIDAGVAAFDQYFDSFAVNDVVVMVYKAMRSLESSAPKDVGPSE